MKVQVGFRHGGRVMHLLLDGPPANVLDRAALGALRAALESAAGSPGLSLVLLEGAGDHFSYGASIPEHRPPTMAALLAEFHGLARDLLAFPAPTAALVRGRCLGGGLELVLLTDTILVAEDAELGLPEVKLGVFAPLGSALLPLKLGAGRAGPMLLTGASLSGREAHAAGLAWRVAPAGELAREAERWVETGLLPHSAAALSHAARAARSVWKTPFEAALVGLEAYYLASLLGTRDAGEGIAAFLEKRPPRWEHR